jgi:hypothetical protein
LDGEDASSDADEVMRRSTCVECAGRESATCVLLRRESEGSPLLLGKCLDTDSSTEEEEVIGGDVFSGGSPPLAARHRCVVFEVRRCVSCEECVGFLVATNIWCATGSVFWGRNRRLHNAEQLSMLTNLYVVTTLYVAVALSFSLSLPLRS